MSSSGANLLRLMQRSYLAAPLALAAIWVLAFATPTSQVFGFVVASRHATIDGRLALVGQTVFSGDKFTVANGGALIGFGDRNQILLRSDTQVSFERKQSRLTASLTKGEVVLFYGSQTTDFRLIVDDMSILPAEAGTEAEVSRTLNQLVVATREGTVHVNGVDRQSVVPKGSAVKLAAFGDRQTTPPAGNPNRAATTATALAQTRWDWVRMVSCVLGGEAIGSLPVLIDERRNASPDGISWEWAGLPAGGLAGALVCNSIPHRPPNLCSLNAQPSEINLGDTVTLSWSSPRGYKDYISDVGPEPSSGSVKVTPSHTGANSWKLTALGAGGTLVCDAGVKVKPAPVPCKLWYTTDDAKTFTIHWTLPEDATDPELTDQTTGAKKTPLKSNEGTEDITIATGRRYNLKYKVDGKDKVCDLIIPIPGCAISARKVGKVFNLEWSTLYAANSPTRQLWSQR